MSLGYTIATPTLLSILSSCNSKIYNQNLTFLDETQKYMIDHLVDCIVPNSELPGGLGMELTQFIDKMMRETVGKKEQEIFKQGSEAFRNSFQSVYKKKAIRGTKKEYLTLLDTYFNLTEEKQKNIFEELKLDINKVPKNKIENLLIYSFLTKIRSYCILGYCTSKIIQEEFFEHEPISEGYIGCVEE